MFRVLSFVVKKNEWRSITAPDDLEVNRDHSFVINIP